MKLFNTLTQNTDEFAPIDNKRVSFYACGPTVYDVAHIGNLRTYLFEDFLRRTLKENGFLVQFVMNITDVDDKTIKKSAGKKTDFSELTKKYEELFFRDLDSLNIEKPNVITRATEYIDKMVLFIEDLMKKGFAYKAKDGSIYFSIDKFKDYGKLSKLDKEGIKLGARVAKDEYNKENPADFALWKAWDEEDGEIFWETSLGKGRPGWHIECSTMSNDVLGESIDIHAGAVDLIFPHHENEIAQSEARSGKKFVNFWVHGEHLLVDSKKMSKSLGNLYTLVDLKEKGFDPQDFRYLILGAHYRSKLNFTWDGLTSAKNARERLERILDGLNPEAGTVEKKYLNKFMDRISDDLDTPSALAILWDMLRDDQVDQDSKAATFLEMNKILGLSSKDKKTAPEEIVDLAERRKSAKAGKDFAVADDFRTQIEREGWTVEDLENNQYKLVKK